MDLYFKSEVGSKAGSGGRIGKSKNSEQVGGQDPLTVVLADDHTLVRQGIETLLEGNETVEIVGQAGDGYQALDLIENEEPDIAILDISMPRLNGLEATRKLREQGWRLK